MGALEVSFWLTLCTVVILFGLVVVALMKMKFLQEDQEALRRTVDLRWEMYLKDWQDVREDLRELWEEANAPDHQDELHLIEERLDRLEERTGLGYAECIPVVSQEQLEKILSDWNASEEKQTERREERCLTGQCDPVGCERELCPHRTQEFTVSPFRGVLHQFDGQELEDTVLLQQPVEIDVFERPKEIDLADSWHHLELDVEPAKKWKSVKEVTKAALEIAPEDYKKWGGVPLYFDTTEGDFPSPFDGLNCGREGIESSRPFSVVTQLDWAKDGTFYFKTAEGNYAIDFDTDQCYLFEPKRKEPAKPDTQSPTKASE